MSDGIVRAPFTPEQVDSLNDFQETGVMHPFMCGRDGCDSRGDELPLVAGPDGWHCLDERCGYQQDWVHAWMADGTWRQVQLPIAVKQAALLRKETMAAMTELLDTAAGLRGNDDA